MIIVDDLINVIVPTAAVNAQKSFLFARLS